MANPDLFRYDPTTAWAFYGHRLQLYRDTVPHRGFEILRKWFEAKPGGGFVFTSNVDGQFHKAGLDNVLECHGSIHHLQCTTGCGQPSWPATREAADPDVLLTDDEFVCTLESMPRCPSCGALARPAILMFRDRDWDDSRTVAQEARMGAWMNAVQHEPLVVLDIGSGTAIPTCRLTAEQVARQRRAPLLRVNPREADMPASLAEAGGDSIRPLQRGRSRPSRQSTSSWRRGHWR